MMFAMMRTGALAAPAPAVGGIPRTRAAKSAAAGPSHRALLNTRRAAMRVTSAHRGIAPRGRAVVRRAAESSGAEASPEDSAEASKKAAVELAAVLEAIASEREALIETEMEQRQKETKALESQEDLELVATKQAQLAATAWEEHAEAEEAVARCMAKSDASVEAMGQAEMLVTEIKAKMSILEIAVAAECAEDDIPCVDDAIEAAGGAEKETE